MLPAAAAAVAFHGAPPPKLCEQRTGASIHLGFQELSIATERKTASAEVAGLSFEAALRELETIVARLEQGEVDLEDSIALYERGQSLKAHCEAKLKAAEGRLEKIVLGANGPESSIPVENA